jgi:uncharacterized membrane protein YbhN (UPF0104 family)
MAQAATTEMPQELSPRHLRKRLIQLALLVVLVAVVVWLTPGLGALRRRLDHAAAGWLAVAAAAELLSTLSYVVIFRTVFCARMSWRMSYQIGMAEQAANALVPAGGAGGLALGAWALSRGGMSAGHIARRTVAFFLLTSLANVGTVVVFAAAFAVGIADPDPQAAFTYAFGAAGLVAIALTLAVPWLVPPDSAPRLGGGRARILWRRATQTLRGGVRDGLSLLRTRSAGTLIGSFGYMGFDIAVLGLCYRAFGYTPPFAVLVFAYLIGQLGGLLPLPGGIGGIEGGLLGTFALYNVPLAASGAAVIAYRALQLWIPGALGSVAFVQLRSKLRRESQPATICSPLAEPIELPKTPRGRPRQAERDARADRAPR